MRFNRLENIIGKKQLGLLKSKKISVFGLGGVGSFAAEALVRSGIGNLDVIDYDLVDISNLNRQIIALESTIGLYKTDVFYQRTKDINPDIHIKALNEKVTKDNISMILADRPDFVLDCIDDISAKLEIIKACEKLDIPLISSMGFANKFHPELIKISTLKKTNTCPLAKIMRKRVKDSGFSLDIPVVYSEEKPANVLNKDILGSTAFCPSSAGIMMASYVVNKLLEGE